MRGSVNVKCVSIDIGRHGAGRGGAGSALSPGVQCPGAAVHCSGARGGAGPVTEQTDTFPASLPGIVQLRTNAADCNQSNYFYNLFQINLNFGLHVGAEVKQPIKNLLFYFFRY